MSFQQIQLIGHLGADPELKYTQQGTPVVNVSVATSENWKDDKGEKQTRTEWHRCQIWNKLAEVAAQHLHKGSQVFIQGKNRTRKYEDKDGVTKYTTEIVVEQLRFLGKSENSPPANPEEERYQQNKAGGGASKSQGSKPSPTYQKQAAKESRGGQMSDNSAYGGNNYGDPGPSYTADDIPF